MGAMSFLQSVLNGVANSSRETGEGILAGARDAFLLPRDAYQGNFQTQPSAMTIDDMGRVLNMAGNVGTGGFAMPKPEGALGMFAGRTSKTADQGALLAADIGETRGHSPQQIEKVTGWFRNPVDDKWRYEISDHASRHTGAQAAPGETLPLSQMLKHDDLYAAYPALADFPVRNKGEIGNAYFRSSASTGKPVEIGLNHADPNARSLLLHEIQHYIQNAEGFAPGANTNMAEITQARPVLDLQTRIDSLVAQGREFSPESRSAQNALAHGKWNAYARAGGEVEARATQERMYMLPEERSARPYLSGQFGLAQGQPVPFDQQWFPGKTRPFIDEAYR